MGAAAPTDFQDFYPKVTLLLVLWSISEFLHPQFRNPNQDPGNELKFWIVSFLWSYKVLQSLLLILFGSICKIEFYLTEQS